MKNRTHKGPEGVPSDGGGDPNAVIIPAGRRILSLGLALCLLLTMALYLPGPVEVYAALPTSGVGNASDGIDFDALVDNGIYYGTFEHRLISSSKESSPTPILWRVMGEERDSVGGGSGNLTLLSEYVLDTHVFNSKPSQKNKYYGSVIQQYLEGSFMSSFNPAEKNTNTMIPVDVVTTDYMLGMENSTGWNGYGSTASGQQAYLMWGLYEGHDPNFLDSVFWSANGVILPTETDNENNAIYRKGGNAEYPLARATYKEGNDPVAYWLRSPDSISYGNAMSVRSIGDVEIDYVYNNLGIRPAFQLNPSSIIFTSEIKSTANDIKETQADGTNYIAAVGGDANFKLTIVNDSIGTLTGMPPGNPTVSLQTGETLYLNNLVPNLSQTTGDYTINYKIVNNTGRGIAYYGFTNAEAVTDLEIPGIGDGGYTVYVWLQKNNEIHSHEGTRPEYFTLNVSGSGHTYGIDLNPGGTIDFGIEPDTYHPTALEKTINITDTGTGMVTDLQAHLSGTNAGDFEVFAVNSNQFTVAPKPGLAADTYEAAVTVAGNYARPQTLPVKFEVTPSPLYPITVDPGMANGSVTVNGGLTQARQGTEIHLTVTPDYGYRLQSGALRYNSSAITGTSFPMPGEPVTIYADFEPVPSAPSVSVDSLTIPKGETRDFVVYLGTGSDGASSANITIGDTGTATATPTQISRSGSVTVTGIAKGQTSIRIGYSGGPRGGDFDMVQVRVTDDSGAGAHRVTVAASPPQGGNPVAIPTDATSTQMVTVKANPYTGWRFTGWSASPGIAFDDASNEVTTFQMPDSPVTVTASYTKSHPDPGPSTAGGGSTGGGSSSPGGSSGGSAPDAVTAKTTLPASAFSWDGQRTLTIDHDGISPLGLLSVRWDGGLLTRGMDYTVHLGSVIVRFDADFIAAQAPGDHTVRVEFLNHTGEATVTVGESTPAEEYDDLLVGTHNPNTGGYPDGDSPTDNPNTGDGRGIWFALLLGGLSGAALVAGRKRKAI